MGYFNSIYISASGLTAERLRMDAIANNLANATTTRTEEGGPYKRQTVILAPRPSHFSRYLKDRYGYQTGNGVRVVEIAKDEGPPRLVYDPAHPDANSDGYVAYPNVNPVKEMVDMITASRAYEANVQAINAVKNMLLRALEIGKRG